MRPASLCSEFRRITLLSGSVTILACGSKQAGIDTASNATSAPYQSGGDAAIAGARSASRQNIEIPTLTASETTACETGAKAPWLVRMATQKVADPRDQYVRVTFEGESRAVCVSGYWGGVTNVVFSVEGGPHRYDLGSPKNYSPRSRSADPKGSAKDEPVIISFSKP